MEFLTLNNGVKMPILGFGTYQVVKAEAERVVSEAIAVGYRSIDTAQRYGNEQEVGNAIVRGGVPREELFLTTKVWLNNYNYEDCKRSVVQSLAKLQTEYLDLVLIHQPFGDYYSAYRALEELYAAGKVRAIGVSNFAPDRLADICLFGRQIVPAVNQIEINPFYQRFSEQAVMERYGVQTEAWAPFGEGKQGMFENEVLREIGRRHGKTAAQVILRWLVQRKVAVLCKSTHRERMAENLAIFDFELSDEEMAQIRELDRGESLFMDHRAVETVESFNQRVADNKWGK